MPQGFLIEPQHLLLVRQVGRHFGLSSPSPSRAGADGKVEGAAARRRLARAPAAAAMSRAKFIGEGRALGGWRVCVPGPAGHLPPGPSLQPPPPVPAVRGRWRGPLW